MKLEVAPETLHVAEQTKFPYVQYLERASTGDREAVLKLIEFTDQVDAAASLGHGLAFFEMARELGDANFSKIVDTLDKNKRRIVHRLFTVGSSYSPDRSEEGWEVEFPVSSKKLGS